MRSETSWYVSLYNSKTVFVIQKKCFSLIYKSFTSQQCLYDWFVIKIYQDTNILKMHVCLFLIILDICNRPRAICISPHAMGFRWTLLFNQKGQFFPLFYSWCGAFGPNMHTLTNKLKPACIWTGWGLWETQEIILNTQCTNHSHQDEGDPKRRVSQCSLPKPRVEVTPRSKSDPRPLPHCVSGKRSPRW